MCCQDRELYVEQPPTVTDPREDYDYVIDGFDQVRVAADIEVKDLLTLDLMQPPDDEAVVA
jgi:hypothetical protein